MAPSHRTVGSRGDGACEQAGTGCAGAEDSQGRGREDLERVGSALTSRKAPARELTIDHIGTVTTQTGQAYGALVAASPELECLAACVNGEENSLHPLLAGLERALRRVQHHVRDMSLVGCVDKPLELFRWVLASLLQLRQVHSESRDSFSLHRPPSPRRG